ncbi:hypothetical protein HELRODRAFT_169061 [Helobdella robusta]|uniref:Uncharacterized protein n=1 Tax=Helobdella robusta TaxID=6412 RepID=T1F1C5_HELRO|nr:hypothetical protein HELRODRAFT_169061 [Helobdella robusta]ESO09120.1 hypothetical protein HELRODRAFT_169061 [Helobdella robusta]
MALSRKHVRNEEFSSSTYQLTNEQDAGFTPLYMAAQENHADVVRYLLDRGANPAIATEDNYTPMAVAVQQNNHEVVDILTEHEQKGKTKLSPLHLAAKKNDVHAVVMLLQISSDKKIVETGSIVVKFERKI